MNVKTELPDVVTDPKTGKYLLTPTTWNGEEKQALYRVEDYQQLMSAMGGIFENPDHPQEVYVEVADDGTFTIGFAEKPMRIDDEGFITLATETEATKERGQGLVEYALILVMVAIVVIVILVILGPAISNVYSNIVANL